MEEGAGVHGVNSGKFYWDAARQYGGQVLLLTCLSAITLFRREMSCNHVYAESKKPSKKSATPLNNNHVDCDELLEGAGLYWGAPVLSAMVVWARLFLDSKVQPSSDNDTDVNTIMIPREQILATALWALSCITTATPTTNTQLPSTLVQQDTQQQHCQHTSSKDPFMELLPMDVQVHILTYLNVKDIATSLASTSTRYYNLIRGNQHTAQHTLWKALWERDFAWIIHEWDIGNAAYQRSQPQHAPNYSLQFYFRFQMAWLNYTLAGHNTQQQCLVGLHGSVYDMTLFLMEHPGSPDTVMVQAGKDATNFFEDMRHSQGARRLAMALCVVVDNGHDLLPTPQTQFCSEPPHSLLPRQPGVLPRRQPPRGTLQAIHTRFRQERDDFHAHIEAQNMPVLSHVNVYWDPFLQQWKAWYTNEHFQTVFL